MPDHEFESSFTQAQSASTTPPAIPAPATPAAPVAQAAPLAPTPDSPVAQPPTPPVAPEVPQTPPVQANPLMDLARAAGIQLGDTATPEEVARLALQQLQTVSPMAQYAQQLLPHAAEFQRYLESRQQPQVAADPTEEWTAEKYFGEQWGSQWDPKFSVAIERGMVQRDENTNLWVPTPGYELAVAGIIPSLNEAQQKQSQNWQEITRSNPYQHFYEKLQEPMRRAWQADVQQAINDHFTRVQQETAIDQFEKQNSAWLYSNQNGQRTVTPHGQKFLSAVDELQKAGVSDPQLILKLAGQISGTPAQGTPAVPAVANPVVASETQQKSFLQNAIDRSGHSAGSVVDPVAPINVQETDLNNMFISALRSSQGQSA